MTPEHSLWSGEQFRNGTANLFSLALSQAHRVDRAPVLAAQAGIDSHGRFALEQRGHDDGRRYRGSQRQYQLEDGAGIVPARDF